MPQGTRCGVPDSLSIANLMISSTWPFRLTLTIDPLSQLRKAWQLSSCAVQATGRADCRPSESKCCSPHLATNNAPFVKAMPSGDPNAGWLQNCCLYSSVCP